MFDRRRFLIRGSGALVGMAAGSMLWRGYAQDNPGRNMITPAAQEAIDAGLAYLARNQNPDGSFGTGQHAGNVAITSLGGLALMSGGHQPGRGRYGRNVTDAVRNILNHENPGVPG